MQFDLSKLMRSVNLPLNTMRFPCFSCISCAVYSKLNGERKYRKVVPVDFNKARSVFEDYLDGYDRENDKVKLKITHTYGVVAQSTEIAGRMQLLGEDVELARIIALLHDIGRFEQLRRFDSFQPDTMDHASFGVHILFCEAEGGQNKMIRCFVPEDTWDDVIRTAIAKHSDFILEGIGDRRALLHARIIRDADKLDNCRVKLTDEFETFLEASAEEVSNSEITPKVREDALAGKSILSADRVTPLDYWVSYLAYFYDLNFRESLDIVEENDYVRRLIHRIPYLHPESRSTMEELEARLIRYVHEAKR